MSFQSSRAPLRSVWIRNLPVNFMQKRAPQLDQAYADQNSNFERDIDSFTTSNELDMIVASQRYRHFHLPSADTSFYEPRLTFGSLTGNELNDLAVQETMRFQDIMEVFTRDRTLPSSLHSFDIRSSHSWAEVLEQISLAKSNYDSKQEGKRGSLRKAGRYVSDHADMVDPWLKLIPDTNYSSVVCGGLKFICGVSPP